MIGMGFFCGSSTNYMPHRGIDRETFGVRSDLGTVKLQLQTTIESRPQNLVFAYTRWIFRFLFV